MPTIAETQDAERTAHMAPKLNPDDPVVREMRRWEAHHG
jgi:hypothetical protein